MCTSLPSTAFCSGIVANGFGNNESITQKDAYAMEQYNSMVAAFACPAASCNCAPVSTACQTAIKAFICADVYRPCTAVTAGTEAQPSTYTQCTAVQTQCNNLFRNVGMAQLDCDHNGIPGGTVFSSDPNVVVNVALPPAPGSSPTPVSAGVTSIISVFAVLSVLLLGVLF